MTAADLLPASLLRRKAIVYVRQSTQSQVQSYWSVVSRAASAEIDSTISDYGPTIRCPT